MILISVRDSFNRGAIDLMVLSLLTESDQYGYQLSQAITEKSGGIIDLAEGTLYPVLYRLLDNGYITDKQIQVGKRLKRIYYLLESEGLKYLQEMLPAYRTYVNAMLTLFDSCNIPSREENVENE